MRLEAPEALKPNMLLHSREGSGDHRPTDINALVEESLNLAYHGARAEKPQFNVTLQGLGGWILTDMTAVSEDATADLKHRTAQGFHPA